MINTKIKIGECSIELMLNYIRFGNDTGDFFGFYNTTNRKIIKFDKFHCENYPDDYFVVGNESIKLCELGKTTYIYVTELEEDFLIDYLNYCMD